MITDNIKISSVEKGDYENIIKFYQNQNETKMRNFEKQTKNLVDTQHSQTKLKNLDKNLILVIANIPNFLLRENHC